MLFLLHCFLASTVAVEKCEDILVFNSLHVTYFFSNSSYNLFLIPDLKFNNDVP